LKHDRNFGAVVGVIRPSIEPVVDGYHILGHRYLDNGME
jgi:hypothetical protein